jgi:hypothetical protein
MDYVVSRNYFDTENKSGRRWLWRQDHQDSSCGCTERKLVAGPGRFVKTYGNAKYREEAGFGCAIVAECEDVSLPRLTNSDDDNFVQIELAFKHHAFVIKDTDTIVTEFKELRLNEDGTIMAAL